MAIHAIVRTDNMTGTKNAAFLKSGCFYNGSEPAVVDNAQFVVLGEKLGREVYKCTAPTADSVPQDIYLTAGVELFYDESTHHYLYEWENPAGKPVLLYKPVVGADNFSATAEAFSGTPEVGKYVGYAEGSTKMVVQDAKDAKTIGKIAEVETVGYGSGRYTYFNIDVVAAG